MTKKFAGKLTVGIVGSALITVVGIAHANENINRAAIAHSADGITTGIGLLQGFVETNPAGIGLIPLKLGLTYGLLPLLSEPEQKKVSVNTSNLTYGAAISNAAIILSGSNPAGWVAGGASWLYLSLCDYGHLPDSVCIWDRDLELIDYAEGTRVFWTAVPTATHYQVAKADTVAGPWENAYHGNNLSFVDQDATRPGYRYQMRACNESGCNKYLVLNPPIKLSATEESDSR